MKKQLTQQHVDDFIFTNFVKSNFYPEKIIKLNTGVYMYANNAATLAAFNFKTDYEFEQGALTRFLMSSFERLKPANEKQRFELSVHFFHWSFFEVQFKGEKTVPEKQLMQAFKTAMPYEQSDSKTFYKRLQHWVDENGYKVNIKGWPKRKITVVK